MREKQDEVQIRVLDNRAEEKARELAQVLRAAKVVADMARELVGEEFPGFGVLVEAVDRLSDAADKAAGGCVACTGLYGDECKTWLPPEEFRWVAVPNDDPAPLCERCFEEVRDMDPGELERCPECGTLNHTFVDAPEHLHGPYEYRCERCDEAAALMGPND